MSKFRNIMIAGVMLVFLCPVAFAADKPYQETLENGLTVLINPIAASKVISIDALIKAGSSLEAPHFLGAGISHFVEHMLFKGTSKRGLGVISDEVKAMGGHINASTDLDMTICTLDVPDGKFVQGLDIVADMLMNSIFDPQEVEKERDVIHGEMRLYLDNPARRLNTNVFKTVYMRHPYQYPVIGMRPLFDAVSRDALFGYYKERYVPNNIILSIAGNVNVEEVMANVRELFRNFKPMPFLTRNVDAELPQISTRYTEEYYQTPHYHFSFAYPSVPLTHPDLFALDVLSMALGQGQGSRLYKELFQKRELVEHISSSNFTPADMGVFEIEGVMVKDNLDEVLKQVRAAITQVKKEGLSKEELDKAKRQVYSRMVYDNQSASRIAYRRATDLYLAGDADFTAHYVKAIQDVSAEDIKRVSKRYLVDKALNVNIIKPLSKKKEEEKSAANVKNTGIEKHVLNNGLTVLLLKDGRTKSVEFIAAFRAGVNQEQGQLNGLSQLFAQVWPKAGAGKKAEQFLSELDLKGAQLSAFAGRNSIGLSAQALSEDVDFIFNRFADIVLRPAFDQNIIEEERQKLLLAINAQEDDVREISFNKMRETLFQKHPLRLNPLGQADAVKRISGDELRKYYQQFIRPNNMVLAVAGDFNIEEVLKLIAKRFANFSNKPVELAEFVEDRPQETRFAKLIKPKEQAVVTVGFQAPSIKDQDRWAIAFIEAVLGSGLGGRLFDQVRDKLGKAYTVGAYYRPMIDTGIFTLFVLTTNDKIDSVKDIFTSQLNDLRQHLISVEEFERAREYLKGSFAMSLDTASDIATTAVFDELYGQGFDFYQQHNTWVDKVTREDIKDAAIKYFDVRYAAIVITEGEVKNNATTVKH